MKEAFTPTFTPTEVNEQGADGFAGPQTETGFMGGASETVISPGAELAQGSGQEYDVTAGTDGAQPETAGDEPTWEDKINTIVAERVVDGGLTQAGEDPATLKERMMAAVDPDDPKWVESINTVYGWVVDPAAGAAENAKLPLPPALPEDVQ